MLLQMVSPKKHEKSADTNEMSASTTIRHRTSFVNILLLKTGEQ